MKKVLVAFVPVIHLGYLDFFKKHNCPLYVIGSEFYAEFPKLERDVRALSPEIISTALKAIKIPREVVLLTKKDLGDLKKVSIVMPDDELSREFAEKYLKGTKIDFESIFLRWNKIITTSEFTVPPNRTISYETFDREMFPKVRKEAKKSSDWWRQNGAILLRDGKILVESHNRHLPTDLSMDVFGDPRSNFDAGEKLTKKIGGMEITPNDLSTVIHAEASVIGIAAKKGIPLEGTSLYCTTFPCPTCAKLVAEAGIKKVFYEKGYSILDAERILQAFGIEIILVKEK
ncbi:MAG: deaminase [Candidatus Pacebacteria bacterium]|nr:deaminase [Candidatus Paceibacterota bacterium]MDD5356927.1 deaminase [Candidatus Paceibacterota bacterium]